MSTRSTVLLISALFASSCSRSPEGGFVQFNTPPAVTIVEPIEGQIFDQGDTMIFRGLVSDNGGVDNLEIQWTSSIDGILLDTDTPDPNGAVELATASLSQGTHIVTLRAIDFDSQQGEARVNVVVEGVPEAPSISIERPLPGEMGLENESFRFMVEVDDAQDPVQDLYIELESDVDGLICVMTADAAGVAYCDDILSFGEHMLTFSVTDSDEYTNSASAVFDVVSLLDYDGDRDGFSPNQGDCDDNNNTVYPGATELCDAIDNDCNDITPIDAGTTCYDDDGDGYCEVPPCRNASSTLSDCNDAAPGINPGANEIPDNVDNDCDGLVDDGQANFDDDGDGYCESPPCVNASGMQPDCNDDNYLVNPAQTEICGDGLDNNCNHTQNEQNAIQCTNFYVDQDEDGYGVNGARECWCEAGPESWPYGATNTRDCYDNNADARPGQTRYFSSHRGDGSYDYDCNGSASRERTARSSGCSVSGFGCAGTDGWVNSVPNCGATGNWQNDCGIDVGHLIATCAGDCAMTCWINGIGAQCFACILAECPENQVCDQGFDTDISVQYCR